MSALDDSDLRGLVRRASEGDSAALEEVVRAVQDDVYRLALRMLWHPDDAEDATQEALVRIITRIDSYRGEAAFRTWAYRVAANHITSWRMSRVEREHLDFRRFGEQLAEGLEEPNPTAPDAALLAEEVKLGCTLGMLLCLDRDQRLAYVLSDVFELPSNDAAYICGVTPSALRQRASRARVALRRFVAEHCGLVNASAACRCDRRVRTAVRVGRVDPQRLLFATSPAAHETVAEMEQLHDLASLMRSHPDYETPESTRDAVRAVITSGRFRVLE